MNTHHFSAMGCQIVVGGGGHAEHAAIEALFAEREAIFSRFIADSELHRVNARAGRPVLVSAIFAEAVRAALEAAVATEGLVDPSLGAALLAAGYDRDLAELADLPTPPGEPVGPGFVALAGRVMRTSPGVVLDLNGVVKAMTVDEALALPGSHVWVAAGGDLATREPLTVALPASGAIELRAGALATSGRSKRRWRRGGTEQHHLIDPRTGAPAVTPWSDVTVCAATCLGADVAAKAAFLLGTDGPAWLDARGLPGRFVAADGDVRTDDAWDRSVRTAACI